MQKQTITPKRKPRPPVESIAHLYIDRQIHVEFKIHCLLRDTDMKTQVEALVKDWMKSNKDIIIRSGTAG